MRCRNSPAAATVPYTAANTAVSVSVKAMDAGSTGRSRCVPEPVAEQSAEEVDEHGQHHHRDQQRPPQPRRDDPAPLRAQRGRPRPVTAALRHELQEHLLEVHPLLHQAVHRHPGRERDVADPGGVHAGDRQPPVGQRVDLDDPRRGQRLGQPHRVGAPDEHPRPSCPAQLLQPALVDAPAGVDDDEVVHALLDLGEQVAADQHRAPLPGEPAQELAQPGDALGIEAVRGLVEDEHPRVAEQRGGQGQPLLHAQRPAADRAARGVGQPDQAQHLVDAAVRHPERGGGHPQVRPPAARRVEALRLQHGADHPTGRVELGVRAPR